MNNRDAMPTWQQKSKKWAASLRTCQVQAVLSNVESFDKEWMSKTQKKGNYGTKYRMRKQLKLLTSPRIE